MVLLHNSLLSDFNYFLFMEKPFLIGISGGSGSGKTSLIKSLRKTFSKKELCIISQDDYYFPIEKQLKDESGIENFDLPNSIDSTLFVNDLIRLIAGQSVEKKEHTFNNINLKPKTLIFNPAPIILVEGIFVFYYKEVNKLLDLKIFVDAKENLRIIRRVKRDQIERGYPLADILHQCEHHVLPAYEKYILPYKPEADLIINNNKNFESALNVLLGFLRHKLA